MKSKVEFTLLGIGLTLKVEPIPHLPTETIFGNFDGGTRTIRIDPSALNDKVWLASCISHELAHVTLRLAGIADGETNKKFTEEDIAVFVQAWGHTIDCLAESLVTAICKA